MAFERFASEADRAAFVAILQGRGYRPAPPPTGELRKLRIGEYRVYDYRHKRQPTELRVSYWMSVQGPRLVVPEAAAIAETCSTPGHGDRTAHARGLCSACYQRWNYWHNADLRKRKRLLSRRGSARRAQRQQAEVRA